MTNIGYSTLTVVPSARGFAGALDRETGSAFDDVGRRGGTRMGSVAGASAATGILGSMKGLAGPLVGVFAALGIGNLIADGVRVGIDALGSAIGEASDLNESLNAVKVSFGAASGEITKLGETASTRLGLSNVQFNAIATQFSAFATTIAGAGGDVTGVIDQLSTRGADFASVFNLDVGEALTLFQSGLAGETEPLRKFGIDLSAAAVESFAYANGIAAQGAELTEAQKVQARYGALLAQTSKTQGDFTNTSDQLANSQRIFNAELANVQAQIGTAFLPILGELMAFANAELIPVLRDLATDLGPTITSALEQSMPAVKDLLAAVVPLLPALVELGVNAIPVVVWALQTLVPMIIGVIQNLNAGAVAISSFFRLVSGDTSVRQFTGALGGLAGGAGDAFRAAINLGTGIGNAVRTIGGFVGSFAAVGRDLFQGLINGVQSVAGRLLETVMAPIRNAVNGVRNFLGIKSPSRVMFAIGAYTGEGMALGLQSTAGMIEKASASLIPAMPSVASPTFSGPGLAASIGSGSSSLAGMRIEGALDLGDGLTGFIQGVVVEALDEEARDLGKGYRP
jgi:phage-related protein